MKDALAVMIFLWLGLWILCVFVTSESFRPLPHYLSPDSKVTITKTFNWWGPSQSWQYVTAVSNVTDLVKLEKYEDE